MKKRIIISIPVLVIFVSVIFLFFMKTINGTSIQHYKQYIIPAKGQIVTSFNADTNISFYVLDEIPISEIAEKENIKNITLVTKDDTYISSNNWEVESGISDSSDYEMKKLSIQASFDREVYLNKIIIEYKDKKEEFSIGSLKICPMEDVTLASRLFVYNDIINASSESRVINSSNIEYISPQCTVLQFSLDNSMEEGFIINNIDFGIDGMGIEPETMKGINGELDFGSSFSTNKEYESYRQTKVVEKLPDQTVKFKIDNQDTEGVYDQYIVSVRKNKEYQEDFTCIYVNPIFSCTNLKDKKEFKTASTVYSIMQPIIANESYVNKILEEYGE